LVTIATTEEAVQKRIFSWLGREWIELSGEARPGTSIEEETTSLFRSFEQELKTHGLSLENTVRTRLWGKDREARNLGTAARSKILVDSTKASSSSYVSPHRFDSDANVALDLLAMKPSRAGSERRPVEFQPPRNYLCYLRYDSVVFLSGYTSDAKTLEEQLTKVINSVASGLIVAGTLWDKLVRISLFLHRSQKLETLKELLERAPALPANCQAEFGFVDGYAGEKSLLEVEATALAVG
jgi:enamine deaminase RidA (YjgF/YER057c/UK114 family)